MGCSSSKADTAYKEKKGGGASDGGRASEPSENVDPETRVQNCKEVKLKENTYYLTQSMAVVRHGDRLDHTNDWNNYPQRHKFPNDTPLTKAGFKHATGVGQALQKTGAKWSRIVASPYLRCAQTASCIAKVLKLRIHFDLDLGEVFDDVSMHGDVTGPQHRSAKELETELKKDFPDVEYFRDGDGAIAIHGHQQDFPENFDAARMRFAYMVKKLMQKGASQLESIVIVTHGDGVGAVIGMLKEFVQVMEVGYTAYCFATRQVKVMEKGAGQFVEDQPVYVDQDAWKVSYSPNLHTKEIGKNPKAQKQAHQKHNQELKAMNAKQDELGSATYLLEDEQLRHMKTQLAKMSASAKDSDYLLARSANVAAFNADGAKSTRILCAPHSKASLKSTPTE